MSKKAQNTLFIFSDEHQREITGCYGDPLVKTPNIDRLAAGGTRFNYAYTNSPICVPARASLATGRYVHEIGNWDNGHPYTGATTGWGHRLMDQGHNVTSIGKLHYRAEEDPTGWSNEIDTLHVVDGIGAVSHCVRPRVEPLSPCKNLSADAGRGESTYSKYDTSTTTNAVNWLKNEAPKHTDKPWTLFLGFVLPHFPLRAPDEFYDMYPDVPGPRLYDEKDRPTHPAIKQLSIIQCYDEYFTPETVKIARTAYYGMVSYLDHCIGQVLSALKAAGLEDTTRIVYTSDHGDNLGNRGLWGKSNMYEESAGIPMIISGADIPKGKEVDTPVSLVDCYQTLVEGAGVKLNDEEIHAMPGHSLIDLANGDVPDRTILSEYHAVGSTTAAFMILDGDYKYVHHVGMRPQLFNLATDPHETTDLAVHPAMSVVLERCEAKLRTVVNPEQVNDRALSDQADMVERNGGRVAVLSRGGFGYTPAPGEEPTIGY